MQVLPRDVVIGGSHILYDSQVVTTPEPEMFDPEFYRRDGRLKETPEGRGSNFFVSGEGDHWVLRHYLRGGFVGKVLHDRYLGRSPDTSRPWREWNLLATLFNGGLPVPRPVAARFVPGLVSYRADLITKEIPGAIPLSTRLVDSKLDGSGWESVGNCIRRFHDRGVFHADLNAHNILLVDDEVYLLDFDRGAFREPGRWMDGNLQRLHRSLMKLKSQRPGFAFTTTEWSMLLHGYHL